MLLICVFFCRPTTFENLAALEDVAEERARRHGNQFITAIKQFCEDSNWPMDVMPQDVNVEIKVSMGKIYCNCEHIMLLFTVWY